MEIGIIGSGNIGSLLAGYLKALGHQVLIANSRGPQSLVEVAKKTGAEAVTTEQAARVKDLVIIAIPPKAMINLPVEILSASQAIIVDAGNYYPSRDGQNADIEAGMTDSEWTAKVIGHTVIKAFNNIIAPSLASKAVPSENKNRTALSVAGDQEDQKQVIIKLIDEIGFDAIDGGFLSESWRQQPGEPAYCQDLNKKMLQNALQEANINLRSENRAEADEIARPYL
jgi:predicted dinucleotide-binding enzyme